MTRIIALSRPPVKSTRTRPVPAGHRFGQGVFDRRARHTQADAEWAAQYFGQTTRDFDVNDPDWDRLADEAAALDRYAAGNLL